jgi:cellulose synthase/poly-beta-1,6-N-acetylglucosamine synthase-like glycosyltransferase
MPVLDAALTVGLLGLGMPWVATHLGLGAWRRRWGLEPREGPLDAVLAVVVPARDEARDIGGCVEALRRLADRDLRVVVVDDHSTDGTAERARAAAGDDPRIRVIPAPTRPAGWAGKAWACHAGAEAAGEVPWLLFVDADVRLDPRTPGTLVTLCGDTAGDVASAFGTWEVEGFWERLLVPAFGWLVRGAVPLARVERGEVPFANGQCLLVRREAYRRAGGHGAVRDDVLDDVGLAAAVQRVGGRVRVRHAPWAFRVRPYRSLAEVVAGYRKNLYAGLDRRLGRAVSLAGVLLLVTVGPVLIAAVAAAAGAWSAAGTALLVLGLQVTARARLEALDGRAPGIALLHPLAGAIMAWTLLLSALRPVATWKGRRFEAGRPVAADDAAGPQPRRPHRRDR